MRTTAVTSYYFAGSTMVAIREATSTGNTLSFVHQDHLGSTSLTTNSSGAVVARQAYYAYGTVRPGGTGNLSTARTYTGQYSDEPNGLGSLMFYNARYYSPLVGRFISADSVVPDPFQPQAYNRYAYAHNNPIRYSDPSGHDWLDTVGNFFGGVAAQWSVSARESVLPSGQAEKMIVQAAIATNTDAKSTAFVVGRIVGGLLATAQGIAEAGLGVGTALGAPTLCTTGVLCPMGVGAALGGLVLVGHGTSLTIQGATAAGGQIASLMSGNPPKFGDKPGPHPLLPPGVKNTQELGEALNWGTGDEALDAMTPDTVNRARDIGMTEEMANMWADWYAAHARWNPEGNLSAAPRVELMRYIAKMLAE